MAKKYAVEMYERDANGVLKPVVVDWETGLPITGTEEYQVLTTTDLQAMEITGQLPGAEGDADGDPKTPTPATALPQPAPIVDRFANSGKGADSRGGMTGGKGPTRDVTNDFGYIGGTGLLGTAASFVPGPIGMVAKAANIGVGLNDRMAIKDAQEFARVTPNESSIGNSIKSKFNDMLGLTEDKSIGTVTVNGKTYNVSMREDAVSNLTPQEARTRQDIAEAYSRAATANKYKDTKLPGEVRNEVARDAKTKTSTGRTTIGTIGTPTRAGFVESYGPKRPNRPEDDIIDKVTQAAQMAVGPGATVVGISGTEDEGHQHGSNRHKTKKALDFDVYDATGTKVTDKNTLKNVAIAAAELGVQGVGAGYMGTGRMHFDTVDPSTYTGVQDSGWGALGNQWQGDLDALRTPGAMPESTFLGKPTERPAQPDDARNLAQANMTGIDGPTARSGFSTVPGKVTPAGLTGPTARAGFSTVPAQMDAGVPTPTARPDYTPTTQAAQMSMPDTKRGFYEQHMQYAKEAGLTGLQAEVAVAQAALESDYGASAPNNNYHGIKTGTGYKGPAASFMTKEQGTGGLVSTVGNFRAYNSPVESYRDYAKQIARNWSGVLQATNFQEALDALDKGRLGKYATDAKYHEKLSTKYNELRSVAPAQMDNSLSGLPSAVSSALDNTGFGQYAKSFYDKAAEVASTMAKGVQAGLANPGAVSKAAGGSNRPATGNMGRSDTPSSGRSSLGGTVGKGSPSSYGGGFKGGSSNGGYNSPGEGNRGVGGSRYGGSSASGGSTAGKGSPSSYGGGFSGSSGTSSKSSSGSNMGRSDSPSSGRSTGSSIGGKSERGDSHAGRAGF